MTGTAKSRLELSSSQQELLKWLAVVTMTLDHASSLIVPNLYGRLVGRVAFPLFAFLLAYNLARRGVSKLRIVRPLVLAGAVSVPVTAVVWGHILPLNILFTLAFGVLNVYLFENFAPQLGVGWAIFITILFGLVPAMLPEYTLAGPYVVLFFYLLLKHENSIATHIGGSCYWLVFCGNVMLANYFTWYGLPGLAMVILVFVVRKLRISHRRLPSLFYYIYYPAHLLALYGIGILVQHGGG
jgi:hypothetical protein